MTTQDDRAAFEKILPVPHWAQYFEGTNEYISNAQHRIEHCQRLNAKWEGFQAAIAHALQLKPVQVDYVKWLDAVISKDDLIRRSDVSNAISKLPKHSDSRFSNELDEFWVEDVIKAINSIPAISNTVEAVWQPIETAPVEVDIIIGAYHEHPDGYADSKWVWQIQGCFGEGEPKTEFHEAFCDDVVTLPNYVCWNQPTHWRYVDKTPPSALITDKKEG